MKCCDNEDCKSDMYIEHMNWAREHTVKFMKEVQEHCEHITDDQIFKRALAIVMGVASGTIKGIAMHCGVDFQVMEITEALELSETAKERAVNNIQISEALEEWANGHDGPKN